MLDISLLDTVKQYFIDFKLVTNDSDIQEARYFLLEYAGSHLSFITYRSKILRFILWLKSNDLTIAHIVRKHILEYIEFMRNPNSDWIGACKSIESKKWRPFSKKLSSNSIYHNMTILRQMFTYLHNIGYVQINPFAVNLKIRRLFDPGKSYMERCLTREECFQILKFAESLPTETRFDKELKVRMNWILQLLIYTAARKSEINNCSMADFIYMDGRLWLKVFGKGSKTGYIPVIKSLEIALNKYRLHFGLGTIKQRKTDEAHIPLIIKSIKNEEYKRFNATHLNKLIKKLCNDLALQVSDEIFAIKLRKVSLHWFRHTSATLQVESGVSIEIVQKNLRHSSIDTTMHYVHIRKNAQHDETMNKFTPFTCE